MKEIPTREQLNKVDKDVLITMFLSMAQQMEQQTELIKMLKLEVESLSEKLSLSNTRQFAPSTEAGLTDGEQLSIYSLGFNEAEALAEEALPQEPEMEEVTSYRRKKKAGKREADLSGYPVEEVTHELSEEELKDLFPNGYTVLPDEVYKKLEMIPSTFKVMEHHVKVYKGRDGRIIKAPRPKEMISNSIATPSLVSAIINAKYVNAVPLNRLSEEFLRQDVNIPRQDLAGWMIRIWKYYLSPVYDRMKAEIFKARYLHCDETPFVMPSHSKEYMWVFHSPGENGSHPVFLYEHLGARNGTVLQEYMKGYHGTIVTDGYQPYHTLMKYSDDIKVAGCWSHSRRMYAEIVKAMPKDANPTPAQAIACEAVKRIDAMYHMDGRTKGSSLKEKLDNRKQSVKPLVDAYFAWIKTKQQLPCSSSKLKEAMNYAVYQEKYLRRFLDDPELPMDNNDVERSIRSFCVGKHNWHIIDSVNGAKASAFLYSIAESAKANGLKPYEYFRYLLSELVKHPRDNVPEDVLNRIMPWSEELPDCCRKTKTR